MRSLAVLAFATATFVCTACSTELSSADIATAGISAQMTVVADGSGQTTATTQLNVDDNSSDFVALNAGDTLVANADGQSQLMTSQMILFGNISYVATFASASAPGTSYRIAFDRSGGVSAPTSTCTIPEPFTIASPSAGASFSRTKDDVRVTYGPSGTSDTIAYSLSGSCIESETGVPVTGDPGTFTTPHGTIQVGDLSSCTITVQIERIRTGMLDPAFGAVGTIQCIQSRTISIGSTP
jgi:hypothetical protein